MKIILVTGSTSSMPLAGWLFQQGVLAGIAVQDVLNNHFVLQVFIISTDYSFL